MYFNILDGLYLPNQQTYGIMPKSNKMYMSQGIQQHVKAVSTGILSDVSSTRTVVAVDKPAATISRTK